MIVEDNDELYDWMLDFISPLSKADSRVLVQYVFALLGKDLSLEEHRRIALQELDVFLGEETERFVTALIERILEAKCYTETKSPDHTSDLHQSSREIEERHTDRHGVEPEPSVQGKLTSPPSVRSPKLSYKRGFDESADWEDTHSAAAADHKRPVQPRHSRGNEGRDKEIERESEIDRERERATHTFTETSVRPDSPPTQNSPPKSRTRTRPISTRTSSTAQPTRSGRYSDRHGGGSRRGNLHGRGHMGLADRAGERETERDRHGQQERCAAYETQGFCLRGDDCPYRHFNPQVVPVDAINGGFGAVSANIPLNPSAPVRPMAMGQSMPGRPPNGANFHGPMPVGPYRPPPDAMFGSQYEWGKSGWVGPPGPGMMAEGEGGFGEVQDLRQLLSRRRRGPEPMIEEYQPEAPSLTPSKMSLARPTSGQGHGTGRSSVVELAGVPSVCNTVQILSEYFVRYGRVVNVHVGYGGRRDGARVEFESRLSAQAALSDPQAVLGNRFIKLYQPKENTPSRKRPNPPGNLKSNTKGFRPANSGPAISRARVTKQIDTATNQTAAVASAGTTGQEKVKQELPEWQQRYVERYKKQQAELARQRSEQARAHLDHAKKVVDQRAKLLAEQSALLDQITKEKLSKEARTALLAQVKALDTQLQSITLKPPQPFPPVPKFGTATPSAQRIKTDQEKMRKRVLDAQLDAMTRPPEPATAPITNQIYVSGIQWDAELEKHFASFGNLKDKGFMAWGKGVVIDYVSREAAAKALANGSVFNGRKLAMVWFVPPSSAGQPQEKASTLANSDGVGQTDGDGRIVNSAPPANGDDDEGAQHGLTETYGVRGEGIETDRELG